MRDRDRWESLALYAGLAALALLVLVVDFFTPLGIAVWILYLIPVALTLLQRRPLAPLAAALACSLLIVVTALTDDPGISRSVAYANRAFGVAVLWAVGLLARRLILTRIEIQREARIRSTQTTLLEALQGERTIADIASQTLAILGARIDAPVAAFYTGTGGNELRLTASIGLREGADVPPVFRLGEGVTGEAARTQRVTVLRDLPETFFTIRSAFASGAPRHVVIVPAVTERATLGVMEFGLLAAPSAEQSELLERVSEGVAIALRSATYRDRLRALLAETQRQAEELQAQQEELRVANEELEEQSRALKASQGRLEQQQAELEATNAQLESQAQELERQQRVAVGARAEAERASQYKSEFLANMSHELRTPLNSALILAKLLAQNKDGRLSEEQVRYAETIHSAGNSLLALINDILDLSKIEAGAVDVHAEPISPRALLEALERSFEPLAGQKHLALHVEVAPGVPDTITSDAQRLQQVLTNLVSNAIKFTERGSVTIKVRPLDSGRLMFQVADTGMGIPRDKFGRIFEAFQQLDSGVARVHGGTGLGLSISRELVHLLGGEITLDSEVGAGTTFTVTIPTVVAASKRTFVERRASAPGPMGTAAPAAVAALPASVAAAPAFPATGQVPDDRQARGRPGRLILVVEDDLAFARILYDLAHELDFDCVVATTTDEGMMLARNLVPSAILLDVQLPDASGLSLLDRLKRNPDTRHIPVHVLSVSDFKQTAFELGAVGYMLKPVQREELVSAIGRIEARLQQRVHSLLLVEDDQRLRESLRALLSLDGVRLDDVGTAQEALARLEAHSYDCVVLDLNLPDASGYDVLETMSGSEKYSFPPVIVYTGRSLSRADEERLRKYSRSVIVKGARSPERLLDEVTLFLHQVEARLSPESRRMLQAARERDEFFEGKTILVVEDDVRNIFALSSVFEPAGAHVAIARNGREALEQVAKSRPDLVLMDIMMPEMDGLTAIRELRRQPAYRDLPIIALTAKAMPDDYERTLAAGANDYMAKPLDVDKLLSLSRVWMSR